MLVLTFRIGEYVYGLKATVVAEVVPPAVYKKLPRSPEFVEGIFNYRGKVTPVVDLSMLATDAPCRPLMSTRIIIIDLADLDNTAPRGDKFLGLLAENITETVKINDNDFETSGLEIPDAPWLGKVARVNSCMLQLIRPEKLLTEDLHSVLFPEETISGKKPVNNESGTVSQDSQQGHGPFTRLSWAIRSSACTRSTHAVHRLQRSLIS